MIELFLKWLIKWKWFIFLNDLLLCLTKASFIASILIYSKDTQFNIFMFVISIEDYSLLRNDLDRKIFIKGQS